MLVGLVAALAGAGLTVTAACALAGLPRSSFYRLSRGYRHYTPAADPVPHRDRAQPAALSAAERDAILAELVREEHADLSVGQVYWRAFDAGRVRCSPRTFYRVAEAEGLVGDRRATRRPGTARPVPRVPATRPGELWSWDATELRGPGRERYQLALVLDVHSRYPVAWAVARAADARMAVEMFTAAITRHGAPAVVHADNGAAMRSRDLVAALARAGAATSYSRPRVSDDNPFSESMFKTLKYDLACPARFDSITHAQHWTTTFLGTYATEHRHSGLGWHTPADVYHGTAANVRAKRQQQLDQYHAEHPERFHRPPQAPALPGPTGINTKKTPNLSQTG